MEVQLCCTVVCETWSPRDAFTRGQERLISLLSLGELIHASVNFLDLPVRTMISLSDQVYEVYLEKVNFPPRASEISFLYRPEIPFEMVIPFFPLNHPNIS